MANEKTPPLLTIFSRVAILAGPCFVAAGFFLYAIFDTIPFRSLAVLGTIALGALLFAYGVLSNLRWLWNRIRQKRFMAGLNVWAAS